MSEQEAVIASQLDPVDYAVYGVLCSAKKETGPAGARRLWRIATRLEYSDETVAASLRNLMQLGYVRQLPKTLGMIHYEAIIDDLTHEERQQIANARSADNKTLCQESRSEA